MTRSIKIITREEYVKAPRINPEDGMKLHRAYYGQFVNSHVIRTVVVAIGGDRLKQSKDPHLNDIPLREWDLFGFRPPREYDSCPSLSDSVCIAKEAARQWLERERNDEDSNV